MDYSQVTVDILQNPKYAGAIESIDFITNWVDAGFGMVITFVAFLIILVAMFKNVLAGAYCAYPKFWDRVNDAHKEAESMSWIAQFKGVFLNKDINNGTVSNAIMRLLPNIKSLTDFETDTVNPKQYFIRAIPQMLACIIVGAFIYNGYYRDTAAKVVDFGSEMIERVLLEVDPIAVYDQFTRSAGRPEFSTDNALNGREKLINSLATSAYTTIIGEYNDIEGAEAKRALANTLERIVGDWVDTTVLEVDATFAEKDAWKTVSQVTLTNQKVDVIGNGHTTTTDGLIEQFVYTFPVSDLNLSSTKNPTSDIWVRIRLNFEKRATSAEVITLSDIQLQIPGKLDGSTATLKINGNNDRYLESTTKPVSFTSSSGSKGTVAVQQNNGVSTLTITFNGQHGGSDTLKLDSTLSLKEHGKSHKVTTLVVTGSTGGDVTISSSSWGQTVKFSDTSKTIGDTKTETATTNKDEENKET